MLFNFREELETLKSAKNDYDTFAANSFLQRTIYCLKKKDVRALKTISSIEISYKTGRGNTKIEAKVNEEIIYASIYESAESGKRCFKKIVSIAEEVNCMQKNEETICIII